MADLFSLPLLQAVNDWQRKGVGSKKKAIAERLVALRDELPNHARKASIKCYRRIAIPKEDLWKLATRYELPETYSAWSIDYEVTAVIHGGVPNVGKHGFIFGFRPPKEAVIVNLHALYKDTKFKRSCRHYQGRISGYKDGIGKFGATEKEVILEVDSLSVMMVHAIGGFSGGKEELAAMYYGHEATVGEQAAFDALLVKKGIALGPRWVKGDAKNRALHVTISRAAELLMKANPGSA